MESILFCNGEILTANARDEVAEAALTVGDKILFAGDLSDAVALADGDTEIYDLSGRALIPGFLNIHPLDMASCIGGAEEGETYCRMLIERGITGVRFTPETLLGMQGVSPDYPLLYRYIGRAERMEATHPLFILEDYGEGGFSEEEKETLLAAAVQADNRGFLLTGEAEDRNACRILLSRLRRVGRGNPSARRHRIYLRGGAGENEVSGFASGHILPALLCDPGETPSGAERFLSDGIPVAIASTVVRPPLDALAELFSGERNVGTSISEALRTVTLHAAYAEFAERSVGSIEWGKTADLTVLSDSLIGCPPSRLYTLSVDEVFLDGESVYRASGIPRTAGTEKVY